MPLVHCSVINEIAWVNHGQIFCNYEIGSAIDIWCIEVSSQHSLADRFNELLSADEIKKASRYYREVDRQRFIVSRMALRLLLSKYADCPAKELIFYENVNKKPFLQNSHNGNVHFNISHSGDIILIAVANSDIGVDVEKIDKEFVFAEILEKNFSQEEIDFIKRSGFYHENFYLLWSRKESLLKATSKGIDDNLKNVPCLDGDYYVDQIVAGSNENWRVNSFTLSNEYAASIAYKVTSQQLHFFYF
ncbi:MAG TPA: 4'-phosphopantetheinyl transferase superfamily protein [Puia sp.]|nr:4'-phosphopantetheinyl transferase superfamily protein [Puia sp.]